MIKNNHNQRIHRRTSSRAADIVQRLPLHRNLSASHAMLVKLAPYWRAWLEECSENGNLSPACCESAHLEAWQLANSSTDPSASQSITGKLIVSCDNASNATQLKQRRQSMIDYLNEKLVQNDSSSPTIRSVAIRLKHDNAQLSLSVHKSNSQAALQPVKESSIRAIEGCQKTVSNEELAKSLKQLAETLRSFS